MTKQRFYQLMQIVEAVACELMPDGPKRPKDVGDFVSLTAGGLLFGVLGAIKTAQQTGDLGVLADLTHHLAAFVEGRGLAQPCPTAPPFSAN